MERLTTLYHDFMVQKIKMDIHEKITDELEDISPTITVDLVDQDSVSVDIQNTSAEDVLDDIKEVISKYSIKKREIAYDFKRDLKTIDIPEVIDLVGVDYNTQSGILNLNFRVNLVNDEDERDEDELKQADREEAEFETYREKQLGVY